MKRQDKTVQFHFSRQKKLGKVVMIFEKRVL